VDGRVLLTEVAKKPAPLPERKKGRRRLGLGRRKPHKGARAAADPTPEPVYKGPKKRPRRWAGLAGALASAPVAPPARTKRQSPPKKRPPCHPPRRRSGRPGGDFSRTGPPTECTTTTGAHRKCTGRRRRGTKRPTKAAPTAETTAAAGRARGRSATGRARRRRTRTTTVGLCPRARY
jgi:hypothetical protein